MIYNGQAKLPVPLHAPKVTLLIMLFHVMAHPLPTLTAKLQEFIVARYPDNIYGKSMVNRAFFPTNPVHGLNQTCH